MRIESNIADIIGRVDRLRTGAHAAVQKALSPSLWYAEARSIAEQTLRGLADKEQQVYVAQFVDSVSAESLQDGMRLSLDAQSSRLDVRGTIAGHLATQGLPLLMGLVDGDVERLGDLILEWVKTEKDKTEIDSGKTNEQIAEKLKNILLDSDRSAGRVAATSGLVPHLQAFYDKTHGAGGLSAEVVQSWLRAVAGAWVVLLSQRIGERVAENLHALMEG